MKYKVLSKQNNSSMCFVCGVDNDFGVKAKFYVCENENGEKVLLTVIEPQNEFQSYPGRMHGGISSALLDEALGRSVQIDHPELWGVTVDLQVKYRKPVPLDETLYIESKITNMTSRAFDGEGKLFGKDGKAMVTANARFLIMPPDKISEEALNHQNWFYVEEDLPKEIII